MFRARTDPRLWVLLMGGRVSRFRVGRDGGHIVTDRNNFWIALAPYFFPLLQPHRHRPLRGDQAFFKRAACTVGFFTA